MVNPLIKIKFNFLQHVVYFIFSGLNKITTGSLIAPGQSNNAKIQRNTRLSLC